MKKFYAVVQGRKPGIYDEWFGAHGAEVQITGFAGAVFKGFTVRRDAEAWFSKISAETTAGQQSMPFVLGEKTAIQDESSSRPKRIIEDRDCIGKQTAMVGETVAIYTDGGCSRTRDRAATAWSYCTITAEENYPAATRARPTTAWN